MRALSLILLLFCSLAAGAVKQGPHGPIELDCARCHSTSGWALRTDAAFDHDVDTAYPLEGMHRLVACGTCHLDNRFTDTGSACLDCHQDPHQGGLGMDCLDCHSPERWLDRSRLQARHERTLFPLTGAHRRVDCAACHNGSGSSQFASAPLECAACHQGDFLSATQPDHVAGGLSGACSTCHGTTRWSSAEGFRHDAFPLAGAHATQSCSACHQGGRFAGTPSGCVDCHLPAWESSANPDHAAADFGQDCAACHGAAGWQPSSFNHAVATGYALNGLHAAVSCAACHQQNQYAGTDALCSSCHLTDFQAALDPPHQEQGYPTDCALCHAETGWNEAAFDHQTTDFPLQGAHRTTLCSDCHVGGQVAFTPTDCWSCHEPAYQATTDPAHLAGAFPQDCRSCHDESAWNPSTLDHQATLFPLRGAHVAVSCAACHTNGQYADNPTDCWSCHQPDYAESTDPAHATGLFPQDCVLCHDESAWDPAILNHDLTDFPLDGAHTAVSCADCHVGGQFTELPGACWNCHEPDYRESTEPDHETNLFSQSCTDCHTTTAWSPSTFDHTLTEFPLTGAHVAVSCVDCHEGGQYTDLPGACWNCHEPDYRATTEPDHEANLFSQSCTECHTTTAWSPSTFDHTLTEFPLTGAHVAVSCVACHVGGQYTDLPGACWNCHEPEYRATTDPDHETNQFSQSCTECHTTAAWSPSTFDHALTDFPLTGAHVVVSCASCHVNGQYAGTPADCWSCHEPEFQSVTDPNHVAGQYPHDCTLCHSTAEWDGATFNHSSTNFPLTGAHTTVSCAQCHVNGQYENTPTDCYFCHQTDYQNAASPEHETHGYPTDCASCHTTAAGWNSSFNHAGYFPIYTGDHRDEWETCASCHLGNDLNDFSCTHCHEHSQSEMDGEHDLDDVPDYVWESHACLNCHPDGSELRHGLQPRHGLDLRMKEPLR
ncbi:MAG: hypothetical protein WC326_15605 [Candidatus Delongbacteria bacterium]